ncbi:two-component system sensor histidine kinase NtrB [Rosettibacter firmus]|uniref:two-component system sensor histidine kinase NtrB n=1 Tax=Rosettibacter firmus TaxID=3111522 RepID=UPI00336C2E0C
MKKLLIEFLKEHFNQVVENWSEKLYQIFKDKLFEAQIRTFVESSITTFIEVLEEGDYKIADQYLIDIYTLFARANLNLLEVSQMFGQGRYAVLNIIEKEIASPTDPVILLGFIDEIIEQVLVRYAMLHQEAKMKELKYERDRLAFKLELNQQYLKNILHTSDSAIMMVDENEKFIAWNKGAERIFGYTEKEIIGKPSSFLLPEGEKYQEELRQIQEEVKKGVTKILETERKTKDGRILSVRLSVSRLPASNGSYSGRSIVIKDFTEYKKLQAQIDQSEKLAVIGQLAAGVAHEIGNPLASISSLVQILQRKSQDPFFSEQLSYIKENIDRISKIVRELVDFSRPPSYERAMHDITDVIKTALGIVKYDKRVRNVKFVTDLKNSLPKINIAADQLLQVFVNILINALDAIEGNGTITVKSNYDDEYIYIDIIDDGCGMDEKTMEKIFDPFFTTKEVGKGTGLGLSVSYGIIKQYNGEILVKSKLNEGSKFTVKIPIKLNS